LKDLLLPLDLPPTAKLFTADAVSMYTNIDTNHALRSIGQYLHTHERHFNNLHIPSLMEALELVMKNNVFTFGDTHWLQLTGTAMGTPPAPCYATIVYAIHENILLSRYNQNLLFYKRYIDDVFGIWVPDVRSDIDDDTTWTQFCTDMTYHKLRWNVMPRSHQVLNSAVCS
jgi:hypothetical protein